MQVNLTENQPCMCCHVTHVTCHVSRCVYIYIYIYIIIAVHLCQVMFYTLLVLYFTDWDACMGLIERIMGE